MYLSQSLQARDRAGVDMNTYKYYQLVLLKGYSWKVDILTRCPTFYSCSKYFVYNLCENRCKVYTFHLMDSDYEEKQNYFPPTSLVLVSTLSFSPSWWRYGDPPQSYLPQGDIKMWRMIIINIENMTFISLMDHLHFYHDIKKDSQWTDLY